MKRESTPSYKRVMRELYGNFKHPDFDKAYGTSIEEHRETARMGHRLKPYRKGPDGRFA